jgi:hypothetical protein
MHLLTLRWNSDLWWYIVHRCKFWTLAALSSLAAMHKESRDRGVAWRVLVARIGEFGEETTLLRLCLLRRLLLLVLMVVQSNIFKTFLSRWGLLERSLDRRPGHTGETSRIKTLTRREVVVVGNGGSCSNVEWATVRVKRFSRDRKGFNIANAAPCICRVASWQVLSWPLALLFSGGWLCDR